MDEMNILEIIKSKMEKVNKEIVKHLIIKINFSKVYTILVLEIMMYVFSQKTRMNYWRIKKAIL